MGCGWQLWTVVTSKGAGALQFVRGWQGKSLEKVTRPVMRTGGHSVCPALPWQTVGPMAVGGPGGWTRTLQDAGCRGQHFWVRRGSHVGSGVDTRDQAADAGELAVPCTVWASGLALSAGRDRVSEGTWWAQTGAQVRRHRPSRETLLGQVAPRGADGAPAGRRPGPWSSPWSSSWAVTAVPGLPGSSFETQLRPMSHSFWGVFWVCTLCWAKGLGRWAAACCPRGQRGASGTFGDARSFPVSTVLSQPRWYPGPLSAPVRAALSLHTSVWTPTAPQAPESPRRVCRL